MKIIYTYKEKTNPLYILGGAGVQRVLLSFIDNGDMYVYFCDDYLRHTYLNKIINKNLADVYFSSNLARIESDTEFYFYLALIERNYNYNGKHVTEKITGHDQGGAVLIDTNGQPLL